MNIKESDSGDYLVISKSQTEILKEFYSGAPKKVALNTKERNKIWKEFKKSRNLEKYQDLKDTIPAFFAEINKSLENKRNIQSAVFSECVYAQAFADVFKLSKFANHINSEGIRFNSHGLEIVGAENLNVRYSYSRKDNRKILIQAGGAGGVDCALISDEEKIATMIELKEPFAKTSEPDLPKYGEDGLLVSSERFRLKYPQFRSMLEEQIEKRLNIFDHVGRNYPHFSPQSIKRAVAENYMGDKLADFICTEDSSGFLVLIPTVHVVHWATLSGEIRPSGRNSCAVWTPNKLTRVLQDKGASVKGEVVNIPLSSCELAKARGSEELSRLKINPLFYVYFENIEIYEGIAIFKIDDVEQNIPTITAKINFKKLEVSKVKEFYADKI